MMRLKMLAFAAAAVLATPAYAVDYTFTGPVALPASGTSGPASSYPITFAVGSGTVSDVNVTFNTFSHSWSEDLRFALVAPDGTAVNFFNRAGGGSDFNGGTYTFDDQAAAAVTDGAFSTELPAGSYQPSVYGDMYNFGFPIAGTTFATFNGLSSAGNWSLYLYDDAAQDVGSFSSVTLSIAGIGQASAVPEPSSWAMMTVGIGMVGGGLRRRTTRKLVRATA